MGLALITDARQIMRKKSARVCFPPPSYLRLLWEPIPATRCLPEPRFHLLMIRAVFSTTGDNVLSALWEISVNGRDSLDLFEMSFPSDSIFILALSSTFVLSVLFFLAVFVVLYHSLYLTCRVFFSLSFPEECKNCYLSYTLSSLLDFLLSLTPSPHHFSTLLYLYQQQVNSLCA